MRRARHVEPLKRRPSAGASAVGALCALALATAALESHASDFTNSLGMTFVRIEPGHFQMGSSDGHWDEQPVREVTIRRAFLLGETEVTLPQFR
ncbi:MAG: hypothetical protein FJ404_11275 [Verrucomicrobia bacterium]|nr:hypothetical protein [Verrucomicrobiota bacterium]